MIYVWRKGRCEHFMRSNILKFNWFLLSLWFLYFPPKNAPKNAELYGRSYFEIYFHFWIDACSCSSSSLFFVCLFVSTSTIFDCFRIFPLSLSRRRIWNIKFSQPSSLCSSIFLCSCRSFKPSADFFFKATIASIRSLIHRNDCEITKKQQQSN